MPDFSAPPPGWAGVGPPPGGPQQGMMTRLPPPRMPHPNMPPPQMMQQPQNPMHAPFGYAPNQQYPPSVVPQMHHPGERPPGQMHHHYTGAFPPHPFGRGTGQLPPPMMPQSGMGPTWEKPM